MPKDIADWLSAQTKIFGNIKFLTEFPAQPKATPLRKTIVSVGLESVKITDFFTENNEGELVPEEYCRLAEIKVRFFGIRAVFGRRYCLPRGLYEDC